MLREFLRLEWERRRAALVLVAVVYAAVPLISLASLGMSERGEGMSDGFASSHVIGIILLIALAGAALAWGAGVWSDERRGGWVYSLSLPIRRVHLFALRYAAGLLWLAVPLLFLGICTLVVVRAVDLPPGVYAYPGAFFGWAALMGWVLYSLMFVLSAGFEHPWIIVLSLVGVYVGLNILLGLGAFPLLSRVVEVVTWSDASLLNPVSSAQLLFGF